MDEVVDLTLGNIVDEIANGVFDDRTSPERLNEAFGKARASIDERVKAAAGPQLQRLVAGLPSARESLGEGCAALKRALDTGILQAIPRPATRELVRTVAAGQDRGVAKRFARKAH